MFPLLCLCLEPSLGTFSIQIKFWSGTNFYKTENLYTVSKWIRCLDVHQKGDRAASMTSLTSIGCDLHWHLDSSHAPSLSSSPVHDPSRGRDHGLGLFPAPCPSLSPFPSLSRGHGAPSRAPALCPSLSFPSRSPAAPFPSFLFPPPASTGAQQEEKWGKNNVLLDSRHQKDHT